ncbi:hypothetical protein A1342_01570 [Methylomonas methanica]|uniref:Uncharacterized protein n=2 Tax=Methylomonas TaxID=416 RepID=A0A140E3L8_9GAMM|nr:hypothetical protein JT25_000570 [Methylomonas denitrificans]OAI02490.1 hypothetical protein A1342_01570 [Methylomonas methanica]
MKFKVSSDANDTPPCVGSILSAHLIGLYFVGIQFTTSTDFGLGKLSPKAIVDVAGHSLGGHLAMAFARLFPNNVDQVVTANGAGFHGAYLDSFFNLLAGHTTIRCTL